MAEFVLRPCSVRLDKIAIGAPDEAVQYDWNGLVKALAPDRRRSSLQTLGSVRPGSYVGVLNGGAVFYLQTQNRTNKIKWLLASDPQFPQKVRSMYRVESVQWDGNSLEHTAGERDLVPGMPDVG